MRRLVAACGLLLIAGSVAAAASDKVTVATSNSSSDVGIYIAEKKGYFRDEGIEAKTIAFDSAVKMVAPLSSGEIDVGSGSVAAGIYNAVARGISIKVVADTGSAPPGYGHNILLVRKDLVASGRFKELPDLKGMRVALTAPGASSNATLNEALKKAGLKFSDIEPVYLGYPDHVLALINKGVDAGLTAEPAATQAVNAGVAIRIMSDDVIDPYHQASVTIYSGAFAKERPEVAIRFMRAYLRAVRYYNGALKDGGLKGPNAEEVIAILTEFTNIKDPAVYRAISPQGCNPDGYVNIDSLRKDFAFYQSQGWIVGKVSVDDLVDDSFVKAAIKNIGLYKAQR